MLRAVFGFSCLLASASYAGGYTGLTSEQCRRTFDAVASIEKTLIPLVLFQRRVAQNAAIRFVWGDVVDDNSNKIHDELETTYSFISDMCKPSDASLNKRPVFDKAVIQRDTCDTDLAKFTPDLVRPLAALQSMVPDLYGPEPQSAGDEMANVWATASLVAKHFGETYRTSLRLCRLVQKADFSAP